MKLERDNSDWICLWTWNTLNKKTKPIWKAGDQTNPGREALLKSSCPGNKPKTKEN